MRRSTTSAGTERPLLGLLLLTELILRATLVGRPARDTAQPAPAPASLTTPSERRAPRRCPTAAPSSSSVWAARNGAAADPHRRANRRRRRGRDRVLGRRLAARHRHRGHRVDEQFGALAGGGSDIAAATTGRADRVRPGRRRDERCVVANRVAPRALPLCAPGPTPPPTRLAGSPKASPISSARPPTRARPRAAAALAALPTDADLDTARMRPGHLAYDRAWWFSRFVADRYGTDTLRALYLRACGFGPSRRRNRRARHLGADLDEVLTRWRQWLTG